MAAPSPPRPPPVLPFYDKPQTAFVEARNLHVGDILQTTTGLARITNLHLFHADTVTYDLTIGNLHTYYAEAGATPVLVHSCQRIKYVTYTKTNPTTGEIYAG